jgi:hypothetical protein
MKGLTRIGVQIFTLTIFLLLFTACGLDAEDVNEQYTTSLSAVPTRTPYYGPHSSTPPHIIFVAPPDGSVINVQDFRDGKHDIGPKEPGRVGPAGSLVQPICVGLQASKFASPGDELTDVDTLLERTELIVDNQARPRPEGIEMLLGLETLIFPEGGEPARVGGPFFFCWQNDLDAGTHTAQLNVRKLSGEVVEYEWSFTLTDD